MKPAQRIGLALLVAGVLVLCGSDGAPAWGQAKASVPAAASASAPAVPVVIYTKDNAPPTPKLEDLGLQDSVSQYGITWTFERPARVGQFVNGDWYVVGPATVKAISPAPIMGKQIPAEQIDSYEKRKGYGEKCIRNGSMLNPPAKMQLAYDSRQLNVFAPSLVSLPPYEMKPGDSLVSAASLEPNQVSKFPYHSGGTIKSKGACPVKVMAVLTCVTEPQPADAFRPAYCDRKAVLYRARNLRRELLPKLERVAGAPDPVAFAAVFQKPWIDVCIFMATRPMENMPHYGQWSGQAVGDAGLLLSMDFTPQEKERLLGNLVQVGIDYWGAVRAGHAGWPCWGGHSSGMKFPIVFAGAVLGDDEMAGVSKGYPKVSFGEDEQTAYGDCWTGAKVVFTGHSGIDAATGIGRDGQRDAHMLWGPYEHLTPDKWHVDNYQSEAYRRANTSNCWVGQALVARLMKLEGAWAHDAFFDYVDRWMTEDDKPWRNEAFKYDPEKTEAYRDDTKTWYHEGFTSEPWVKEMWTKYRSRSAAPTDGWKKKHDDSYYRTAIEKQPPTSKRGPAPGTAEQSGAGSATAPAK